ncbi:type II toxin-antitoxin system prevent-host-death family antitoxin [Calidifontimicrobium sp. SYSU G02091]|uniref:type II toxin-antitoxin system prevent-host-death family antitoxin n=1 Tax=Calidifontimicrobium sp. SYSU G02091 TaxID=2926421 RepID=UPI001F52ED17|nr:type II toxin-antitoxin system prevent-host-death family antitoxin [Calidifontimicrobium sp. SYSU G02091]MCI1191250.1 type II toxin-antitoxin system prevent-host-death family antitoxin [Calidifontimicrobium sp. SYSU G02091]
MPTSVTATEAKNRLGQVLERSQREPVFIEKAGRPYSVVISSERYAQLLRAEQRPAASGHDAGAAFYEKYKDWVDEQNRLVDRFGIPGEEFRPW